MCQSIIKVEKSRNFTIMHNEIFKNPKISAKAKGIFAYIMTLPEDWKLSLTELKNHFSDGREAISSGFKELEKFGYALKGQVSSGGKLNWVIIVFEKAKTEVELNEMRKELNLISEKKEMVSKVSTTGIPIMENPTTENPTTENPTLLNTNNTKYLNILNTNNTKYLNSLSSESCSEAESKKENADVIPSKLRESKKNKTKYSAFEYDMCIDLAISNQTKLSEKDKTIVSERYSVQTWRRVLKPLFDNYGVENVIQGIKNSVNFDWLVKNAHYSFNALFSARIFPKCINNTFTNPYGTKGDAVPDRVLDDSKYEEDWRKCLNAHN